MSFKMQPEKISDPKVAAVFDSYPVKIKAKLLFLRQLILDTACKTEGAGKIEEALKWGEPSYLTSESRSGSTIRIHWKESLGDNYAIYFKCTSLLIPTFRRLYPTEFKYEKNRAIVFSLKDRVPVRKLRHCISMALTYHLIKDSLKE